MDREKFIDYQRQAAERQLGVLSGEEEARQRFEQLAIDTFDFIASNGGDYWRQAVFYKILVDHYPQKDWKAVSTEFDFIEPDKKKNYRREKIIISPADSTTVTQQIETTWQKIQNREFYIGCGKEDCHWCKFVKDNKLAVALHDLDEEEE